jgi:hypothetical protein
MQHYTYSFLLYLVITVFTESIVVFWLLRKALGLSKNILTGREIFSAAVIINCLTLPYVWFVFPIFFWDFNIAIWTSEIFVFVIEAIFYKFYLQLSIRNASLISLIANLASFSLGKFLHFLFNHQ